MDGIATFVSVLFSLNLLLGAFNLLPFPPLDGFSALAIFMSESAAHRWYQLGRSLGAFSIIGLLIAWKLFGSVYGPIFLTGLRLLYPSAGY